MPATYAPGPRCNCLYGTRRFWGCQDLNTRYSVSLGSQAPHVGGLPVDKPATRLGTPWVLPVETYAKPGLANWVEECEREGVCGNLRDGFWGRFGDLDALDGRPDPDRHLLALAVGVLEHGDGPLQLVLEDALEHVQVAFDVDEGRLHPLHVQRARELEVQLVKRQQVGEGHAVANDHHVALVRLDDGAAAHVVGGVGDDRQGKCRGDVLVDVLAHLAHAPLDLALDLAGQLRASRGVEGWV